MARERRRPCYYMALSLHDGTVTAAYPIRRPSKQELKQNQRRIDPDGVARGYTESGYDLRNVDYLERFRFQDIISTSLNTKRAIRQLVLPRLEEMHEEMAALREQLDRIEAMMTREPRPCTTEPGRNS
jgi:hypothetical protein